MTKLALIAALLLGTAAVPAVAADLMISPEPIAQTASFSWQGPYVGAFISSYPGASQVAIGGELGYNFLPTDNFLLGLSVEGAWYFTGYAPEAFIKGRAGFVSDRFAVYGFGALGNFSGGPGVYGLGAGVEFAATDSISLDAEGGIYQLAGGGGSYGRVEAGVRFHF
ncbi:MAG: hypothetical protein ABI697_08880 [Devosia sp.]